MENVLIFPRHGGTEFELESFDNGLISVELSNRNDRHVFFFTPEEVDQVIEFLKNGSKEE
jgi:hypothetical protein